MVKLVRLKTNNKDGIFDCRFDDNIKLKPNAEIALKNINDGQLLKDLLHTTEVIFLIHPLE